MVAVESKANERQVVAGVSLWDWECFFRCVVLWDVVKVPRVGITIELWNHRWNSCHSYKQSMKHDAIVHFLVLHVDLSGN